MGQAGMTASEPTPEQGESPDQGEEAERPPYEVEQAAYDELYAAMLRTNPEPRYFPWEADDPTRHYA